jgi:hypothetical protein
VSAEPVLPFRVNLTLFKDGHLSGEFIAENASDLYCRIEMDTGISWLDTASLYQALVDKGCEHKTETFRVCNSYEKWGAMQQEVVKIKVQMRRVEG